MIKFVKYFRSKITSAWRRVFLFLRVFLAKRNCFILKNDRALWSIVGSSNGRDAVVIGMGPSFRKEDVERFKGYQTFACNKIFLMSDANTWRPDYYSITDFLVAENNVEAILDYKGAAKFIHPEVVDSCPELMGLDTLCVDRRRKFSQSMIIRSLV